MRRGRRSLFETKKEERETERKRDHMLHNETTERRGRGSREGQQMRKKSTFSFAKMKRGLTVWLRLQQKT